MFNYFFYSPLTFFVHIVVVINYTGPVLIPAYPLSTCFLRDVNSENLIEGVFISLNHRPTLHVRDWIDIKIIIKKCQKWFERNTDVSGI